MRYSLLTLVLLFVSSCGTLSTDVLVDKDMLLTHQSDMMELEQAIAYCKGQQWPSVCCNAYAHAVTLLPRTNKVATVVLDLDMTLMQGHQFNEWLLRKGVGYSAGRQYAYLTCNDLPAVPGALDFIKKIQNLGYTVVFVTNRKPLLQKATRKNLIHLGLGDIPVLYRTAEKSKKGRLSSFPNVVMTIGDKDADHLEGALHVYLPNPLY